MAYQQASDWTKYFPVLSLPVLTLSTLFAVSLYILYSKWRFYQLAFKVPGPFALPLLGNAILFFTATTETVVEFFEKLHEDYGGTARLWLGPQLAVLISKPEDLKICFSNKKFIDVGDSEFVIHFLAGQGLLAASGDAWRKQRHMLSPIFQTANLKRFVKVFDCQSQKLAKRLEIEARGTVSALSFLKCCNLSIIQSTIFETSAVAAVSTDLLHRVTVTYERCIEIAFERMLSATLYFDFLFNLSNAGREFYKMRTRGMELLVPFIGSWRQGVNRHLRKDDSKGKSFGDVLLMGADKLSDKQIEDQVLTMIVTGYETTARTVEFVLVMLAIHPTIQEKVYQETKLVEEMLNGRNIEAEDLKHLQYTDMVIKETLRLFPISPITARKAPSEMQLESCTVPSGADILLCFLATHRDPAHWKNPNEFNPDNFLPENTANRHPFAYVPFSGGPRNCIGQSFAKMSVKVIVYNLMRHLRVTTDMKMEDIKLNFGITLGIVGGSKVRFEPRQ